MSREPMACWLRASFYWLRGSVSSRRLQPGVETGDLPSGLHLGEENQMRAGLSNCGFPNFQKKKKELETFKVLIIFVHLENVH